MIYFSLNILTESGFLFKYPNTFMITGFYCSILLFNFTSLNRNLLNFITLKKFLFLMIFSIIRVLNTQKSSRKNMIQNKIISKFIK